MKKTTAKNSTFLKSIRIRRFRSIEDSGEISLAPITVFVGANDSGKSNILKAINLFFNSEVVLGSTYDHSRDFSKIATKRAGKADEAVITTHIQRPDSNEIIRWRKVWRDHGYHQSHNPNYVKGLKKYSKTPAWLGKLNYRYVPATKDRAYMQALMRELYQLFSDTIDKDMRAGAGSFTGYIRKQTANISKEMEKMTSIGSKIQLPQDLSGIFSLFDFETDRGIFLDQRGDGIRVRYIPAILNFLADKSNHPAGTVRGSTIWGYEEPENNLEMGVAFEQARKFREYSRHIQILITTHSPAFYNMIKGEDCKGYVVSQLNGVTTLAPISDPMEMDKPMGVMSLVAPYAEDANRRLQEAEDALKRNPLTGEKIIFVEGKSDRRLVEFCIAEEFSDKQGDIVVREVGGAPQMPHFINVMSSLNGKKKFVGLLDNDCEGRTATQRGRAQHRIILVEIPDALMNQSEDATIEHLLPKEYWQHALKAGMLEETPLFEKAKSSFDLVDNSVCLPELALKTRYQVASKSKTKFVNYAIGEMKRGGIPKELSALVKKLIDKLEK